MTTRVAVAHAADLRAVAGAAPAGGPPPGWLGPDETDRWRALRRPVDRDGFLAARVLARLLLTHSLPRAAGGAAPRAWRITQSCPSCERPHGRPRVDGAGVSWAHAGDLVAAAVTTDDGAGTGTDVGVDVELVAPQAPPLAGAAGDPVAAWLRWTRLEALVKRGDGDLDAALVWPLDGPPAPGGRPVRDLVPHLRAGTLTDVVSPRAVWVASVAAPGPARVVPLTDLLPHA